MIMEFVPNGNLMTLLQNPRVTLSWAYILKVALNISGL
jgi:hypothetical protein